jgi:TIR domain
MAHIFISYARKDAEAANRLVTTLAKAGYEAWIDREISGGELWKKRIVEAIEQAKAFLILLSPNSVASDNVRKELDIAENRKKLILPLVIAAMKIPPEMEYSLAGLQRIDFAADPSAGDRQLLSAIQSLRAIEQNVAWVPWMKTKEGLETLNAILSDTSRSVQERVSDYLSKCELASRADSETWLKRLTDLDRRHAAIAAERENLEKKKVTLMHELGATSSGEMRELISEKITDINRRLGSLESQSIALSDEERSLYKTEASDYDKLLERGNKILGADLFGRRRPKAAKFI